MSVPFYWYFHFFENGDKHHDTTLYALCAVRFFVILDKTYEQLQKSDSDVKFFKWLYSLYQVYK
jgi:hypothetical protein